jgi:hypothetical protein
MARIKERSIEAGRMTQGKDPRPMCQWDYCIRGKTVIAKIVLDMNVRHPTDVTVEKDKTCTVRIPDTMISGCCMYITGLPDLFSEKEIIQEFNALGIWFEAVNFGRFSDGCPQGWMLLQAHNTAGAQAVVDAMDQRKWTNELEEKYLWIDLSDREIIFPSNNSGWDNRFNYMRINKKRGPRLNTVGAKDNWRLLGDEAEDVVIGQIWDSSRVNNGVPKTTDGIWTQWGSEWWDHRFQCHQKTDRERDWHA